MSDFDGLCYFLATIYGLLLLVTVVQLVRLHFRDACYWPYTVQQQVHAIILMLCSMRFAFCLVATTAWNPDEGEVESQKVSFYSLDEFATLFYFSLASVLALFWAELYHVSTDSSDTYYNVIRPLVYVVNILALFTIAFLSIFVSDTSYTDVDYVFIQYTITVASTYLFAAVVFAYYSYYAGSELKQIPVQLSTRKQRLFFLRVLSAFIIGALITKAILYLIFTGDSIVTNTVGELGLVFLYYFMLEIVPISIVLMYYKVEAIGDIDTDFEEDDESKEPLAITGTSNYQSTSGNIRVGRYTQPKSAPTDLVDRVIAGISS